MTESHTTNVSHRVDDRQQVTDVRIIALVVVLVAFALRAYHLDYQSLWSDEGISLLRAAQPLNQLWRTMPVEHVPGYFALLNVWMHITGDADFALRYLSLLPSVFAVALMMRAGRDLGSQRIGLISAVLVATSAFQVWYGQEVRMYSWLFAAGLISTWCLWLMFTRPPSAAVWIGYVLSTTAAIYLHYFGFLVPIVHSVVAVLWLALQRDVRAFLRWMAAGAAVFVLFLPWSTRALALFSFSGWRAPIDPNKIPWLLIQAYAAGETMPAPWARWVPVVHLGLIVLGVGTWLRRERSAGLFLTTISVSSVLLTWLLVTRQPDFHVRYTIFLSAPLVLLTAGGVAGLDPRVWRPGKIRDGQRRTRLALAASLPWLVLVLLVIANGIALNRLYNDEFVHKPDFRAAAALIQNNLEPGDVVLIDGPNPDLVFEHYYSGDAPVYDLRTLEGLPDDEVAEALREITAGSERAWELLYFKPPGPVQVWLATRGWSAPPTFHNNIRVQLIGLDSDGTKRTPLGIHFGEALELIASEYELGPHRPGDLVRIATDWFTHEQAPELKFSLRLWNENGVELSTEDYVPQNWFAPTNVWVVGKPARDQHGLLLPNDLAPGPYHVTLRLYDPYTGVPADTSAGVDVIIAEFMVEVGVSSDQ